MRLENKVVVVFGGSGRIGREFSKRIAAEGGVPVICDIDATAIDGVVSEIRQVNADAKLLAAPLDVNDASAVRALPARVAAELGSVDAVVNSAYPRNKQYGRDFWDVTYEDFCENVSLNLGSVFIACQAFARHFVDQGHGNIINIGSTYGVVPPRFEVYEGTPMTMPVEYAAIKAGTIHLTQYLAKRLKKTGVRVNTISPGGILDGQPQSFLDRYNDMGLSKGMLDAEDICGALVFLLSEDSKFVNGQNLLVDDGWTI